MPYHIDAGLLFYRSDLLKQYGYRAPPATWTELETMATLIQKGERSKGNKDFWGFVWQGSASEGLTCNALEWQLADGGGNIIEKDRTISVNNPKALRTWERAARWVGTISPPGVIAYREWDALNIWRAGNAAFMRNWPTGYLTSRGEGSTIADKFDRSVITAMAEGVLLIASDHRIVACNRSAEQILGMSEEQLLRRTALDNETPTVHEDGSPFLPNDRPSMKALLTGQSQSNVCMGVRKLSGELCWLSINAQPLFRDGSDGKPYGVVTTFTDISERRRAEEALRRSEQEFHTIFDHAAIGMVLIDAAGYPLRSNPAFLSMLGYRESELAGLTLADLTHPEDVALDRTLFQNVVEGHVKQYQVKKRYIRKDGEIRSARLTVSALRTDKQELQYSVAMVEDVTSQETAERKLLQISNRLLRIQEEEQRRIAREIHDSTSQEITALTLNLGALRIFHDALPEKASKLIAESLALTKRVAREIRTFAYLLHPPMLTEFGLWNALRMFVEEFSERSGVLVGLEISPEVENIKLTADQEIALFRFIQEALANVHRHSGSDSASIDVHFESGCIEAVVRDAGSGIPPGVLEAIRQSDGQAGGVGLPGMRERIGYVGGEVRIESDEHGTTVAALIPAGNRAA
ncbi:MAG: extracellular solute-binding protein [Acidobacteriia bacterium]|nr:extracellular solute-binding protein [Terriglobia bacterium]